MSSITSEAENEYDFFNIKYPKIKEFGQKQLKAFWLPSDISYDNDGADFERLDVNTKRFIERTIAFFFSSDGIVFKNLGDNFMDEFKLPEIKYTYSAFETMELIHADSYGLQLDSIVSDYKRKKELMHSIKNIECIKGLADWAIKYMDRQNYSLIERMIAFLCVEGIFFSAPFASIFWLRQYHRDKLKGMVAANDLISRDENIHCEFAVYLINILRSEGYDLSNAIKIISSAVDQAILFVKDSLPEGLIGMNVELMVRHVKSVANRWSEMINVGIIYPDCKKTPFNFMENISLEIKKNFFEVNAVTEYQKAPEMNITYNETF